MVKITSEIQLDKKGKFAQILLGTKYKDYTSGFALIKKSILEDIKISRKGFGEYFIEFL